MRSTVPLLVHWVTSQHAHVMHECRSGAARLSCVLRFMVLLAIACVHVVSHEARLLASVLLQCVSYRRCILWLQVALASSLRALCGAL